MRKRGASSLRARAVVNREGSPSPTSIGRANPGTKAIEAAVYAMKMAVSIGMIMVFTDPLGRVFALDPQDHAAERWSQSHPLWMSGVFTATALPIDIAEAIVATHRYHKGVIKAASKKIG
jgi:hypothetical protein